MYCFKNVWTVLKIESENFMDVSCSWGVSKNGIRGMQGGLADREAATLAYTSHLET